MKVSFETVVDGVNRYLDKEIYSGLNDVQEFMARLVVGRINQNMEAIKQNLLSNGFIKTLGFVDHDGMVDVDLVLHDVQREIERQGNLQIYIPMIGKITFKSEDVDVLRREITGR
jgi:hypothetical protein